MQQGLNERVLGLRPKPRRSRAGSWGFAPHPTAFEKAGETFCAKLRFASKGQEKCAVGKKISPADNL